MATLSKQKKRRRELIAGVVVLSVIFVALVVVAVVLFQGETPRQVAKPTLAPLPVLENRQPAAYPPEAFVFDGSRMTLADGQGIPGIDVSRYQGEIDWQQVKDSGVEFVLLRLGYRGYGNGALVKDPFADANYQGAKAAGLNVGVYFFSQSINLYEAAQEAQWVMENIRGWELELPVVYDWELPAEDARTANVTAGQLTAFTRVFNRILQNNGYGTMVYFNRHHASQRLYLHRLTDYPHWLAMYQEEMSYPYEFAIWQYSESGSVPGIDGNVDLNLLLPGSGLWGE